MSFEMSPDHLLRWYIEAGVDETIGEEPLDRYALAKAPPAAAAPIFQATQAVAPHDAAPPMTTHEQRPSASHLADACKTLEELHAAMQAFDGCALKKTCQRTVFADGNPKAKVMLVGEAPGADEDRIGLPFVGASGKLLDRMLASIGLDRSTAYITNVIPWRPPGNRKPEPAEVALCLPFIERHIELVDPEILIFLGGAAASALLAKPGGINRLRGRWMDYQSTGLSRPVPAMATFHPAYLLRTPSAKREAWQDFLAVFKRLQPSA